MNTRLWWRRAFLAPQKRLHRLSSTTLTKQNLLFCRCLMRNPMVNAEPYIWLVRVPRPKAERGSGNSISTAPKRETEVPGAVLRLRREGGAQAAMYVYVHIYGYIYIEREIYIYIYIYIHTTCAYIHILVLRASSLGLPKRSRQGIYQRLHTLTGRSSHSQPARVPSSTYKLPKIMDPILPILSSLGYWAIISARTEVQEVVEIGLKNHKRAMVAGRRCSPFRKTLDVLPLELGRWLIGTNSTMVQVDPPGAQSKDVRTQSHSLKLSCLQAYPQSGMQFIVG